MINRQFLFLTVILPTLALGQVCNDSLGERSTPTKRFKLLQNGTALDTLSSLEWTRCSLGQEWTGAECKGFITSFDWQEAKDLANDATLAGHDDWRLPTLEDMETIIEHRCVAPSINLTVFPNTPTFVYWTASSYGGNAWRVYFGDGFTYSENSEEYHGVRLVRDP